MNINLYTYNPYIFINTTAINVALKNILFCYVLFLFLHPYPLSFFFALCTPSVKNF